MTHEMNTGTITDLVKARNVEDHAGNDPHITSVSSSYINNGQECVEDINLFLERPVRIASIDVSSGDFANVYDIWDLLSSDERVRDKFKHFAYFHGGMEITVSISGTPFHYGRVLVSYQPYNENNVTLQKILQLEVSNPITSRLVNNYLTQSKYCRIMDVKDNVPIKMQIPFISHKPQFRLFDDDIGGYYDFRKAGALYVRTLNSINNVSGTASDISIVIYANFTNVKLGTLTSHVYNAESKVDEQKTGPIEEYSSKAISILNKATNLEPSIAPFTVPANIVLSGVNSLAAHFGWSKPIMDEHRSVIKPDAFNNGAVTIINDTSKQICVDPKRSLEVSSTMFGHNTDELVIENICNRWSYLQTFNWGPENIPFASPIQQFRVTPTYTGRATIGISGDVFQPTALSFASAPFAFWRGDIEFVFEMVCSAYHRGKLAFCFEPYLDNFDPNPLRLNDRYVQIVDLQNTQLISICVPWASERPWRVRKDDDTESFVSTSGVDYTANCNGRILIYPVNNLQSPDNSSVPINVYVRGKNMHFAMPISTRLPKDRTLYNAESLFSSEISCLELNKSDATDEHIHDVCFGEKIYSFRSLLKRYHFHARASGVNSATWANFIFPIYPEQLVPYSSSRTEETDLISYLRYAYLSMRGSFRYRMKFFDVNDTTHLDHINFRLMPPETTDPPALGIAFTNFYRPINFTGGVTFIPNVNAGLEVEIPFYSNNLWVFSQPSNYIGRNLPNEIDTYFMKRVESLIPKTGTVNIYLETASGEDFNLHYFTGAPPYSVPA